MLSRPARGAWSARLFRPQDVEPLSGRMMLLDGLRGLAALAVIFFHYDHFLQLGPQMTVPPGARERMPLFTVLRPLYDNGHYAVQVFWIISGFVFATVYYGRRATTREFIVNRLARLYPLHLLTLCIVAVLQAWALAVFGHWLIYGGNTPANFLRHLLFYAWRGDHGWAFNGPIWSVSVEIIIYVVFWMTRGVLPRIGVAGPALASLAFMGLMAAVGHHPILACGFYFFWGATVATARARLADLPLFGRVSAAVSLAGLAALIVAPHGFRDYVAIPASCGGFIALLALAETRAREGVRRIAGRLGDYSYGVYLWHIPVQLVILLTVGRMTDMTRLAETPWFLPLFLGLVVALATVSFHGVEAPARRAIRRLGTVRGAGPAIAAP